MIPLTMTRLNASDTDFAVRLARLLAWDAVSDEAVASTVRHILDDVRVRGDAALLEYTARFDRLTLTHPAQMEMPLARLEAAYNRTPNEQRRALEIAAERVRDFHLRQKAESWTYTDAQGNLLGQRVTPLDRVGLYVPGGKAAYPSSVLMNAIPAQVAGVGELIMVVPTPDGECNDLVLAAAKIAGVTRVFTLGGAQAVAALAYGTATVPAVDKIVGPGNIYVATAKKMVYGTVGIDMIAGPSEIVVVCDGLTDPRWIAMDLFSQAEHDEDAQAILISPDAGFLDRVMQAMTALLPAMARADVIRASLTARGALIAVRDLAQAVEVVNTIAPEHLELSVEDPQTMSAQVRHAGAIFMGRYTAEALGDYVAGPNHVLPTSRTARFSSPLGVYDFQKRTSLIMASELGSSVLGAVAAVLARGEGLDAHARSAEYRIQKHR